ncbi:hypothetical protein ACROYT_G021237 [Oculina patagonica]
MQEYDDESSIDRLQRALRELEKRVERYFEDLSDIEKNVQASTCGCREVQLKAKVEKKMAKRDAEIQDKLFSAVKWMLCFKAAKRALDLQEYDDESSIDRLQRALRELEKRVERYFEDLSDIEKNVQASTCGCREVQLKAKVEKKMAKRDAEIQDKLFSAVKWMLCFKAAKRALVGRISVFVDGC